MEAKGCCRQWEAQRLDLSHTSRRTNQVTEESESYVMERKRGAVQKSVTIAPVSRFLTNRHYVMRKPLVSVDHVSILKKVEPQNQNAKEKKFSTGRRKDDQKPVLMNLPTKPREEVIPERVSLSHGGVSSASVRGDLQQQPDKLPHEETTFGSLCLGSDQAQQNFSSSVLQVQSLNPRLRPRLTSTVLYPTSTAPSRNSRHGHTDSGLSGQEADVTKSPPAKHVKGRAVSPFQASYWACAVPSGLPPSPDRHSAGWDPNKEYQALLDYTYPLRPGVVVSEGDGSELNGKSSLQRQLVLQDSGIELCSSSSLSGLGFSLCGTGQRREKGTFSIGHRSFDLQGLSKSPHGLLSPTDPVGLSSDSLDYSKDPDELNRCTRFTGDFHHYHRQRTLFSTALIRSTRVLPQSRCLGGDVDEEFRPLPDQLEELQVLSRQVREVTEKLSQTVNTSWESQEPGTTSVLSPVTLPDEQELGSQKTHEGREDMERQETWAPVAAQFLSQADDDEDCETKRSPSAWMESAGGEATHTRLREVEALVEQLCGLGTLPETLRCSREDQEEADTLMQHIQVFCFNLEKLIQWLHRVSEKMDLLVPPSVDISSVKTSLAEYQSLQREVSSHQPLTSCVLQAGQHLLSCINTTSPFLSDALLHIERHSRALENHNEQFFSSILSAMDSLTHPVSRVQEH